MNYLIVFCLAAVSQVHAGSGLVTEHTWGSGEGVACQGFSKGANNIAISDSNYNGGDNCGKCVRITGDGGSAVAMIVDQCMGCVGVGSIFDLPPGLFKRVTGVSYDIKPVKYEYVDCNDLGSSRDPETDGGAFARSPSEPKEDPEDKNNKPDGKTKNKEDQDDSVGLSSFEEPESGKDQYEGGAQPSPVGYATQPHETQPTPAGYGALDEEDAKCQSHDCNNDGKRAHLGEQDSSCHAHSDCKDDLYCNNDGKCAHLGEQDSSCHAHSDCKDDLYCNNDGKCAQLGHEGAQCREHSDCASDLACTNGLCTVL